MILWHTCHENEKRAIPIHLLYVFGAILPFEGVFTLGLLPTYGIKYVLLFFMWITMFLLYPMKILQEYSLLIRGIFAVAVLLGFWEIVTLIINGQNNEIGSSDWIRDIGKTLAPAAGVSIVPLVIMSTCYGDNTQNYRYIIILAKLLTISISTALIISWAFFLLNWHTLIPSDFLNESERLYGVIGNPNLLSIFAFALILCGVLLYMWNEVIATTMCFYINLGAASLVASVGKASILAAAVAVVIFIAMVLKRGGLRRLLIVALTSGMVGACVGGGVIYWRQFIPGTDIAWILAPDDAGVRPSDRGDRDDKGAVDRETGGSQNGTWQRYNTENSLLGLLRIKREVLDTGNRLELWDAGLTIWRKNWVIGIGPANWGGQMQKRGLFWKKQYSSPHNGFIEISGSYGILGSLVYLFLVAALILLLFHIRYTERLILSLWITFTLIREVVATSSLITFGINGLLFWLICAIVIAPSVVSLNKKT